MALPFIFFGWPMKQKDIGPAYPEICDHCNNHTYFHLVKERRWFSLFFIPILPLGKKRYYMQCRTCAVGAELTKQQATHAKDLAEATRRVARGELTKSQYEDAMEEFEREALGRRNPDVNLMSRDQLTQYCTECGQQTYYYEEYCSSCGEVLPNALESA